MPTKCWGVTRRAWLAKQTFDFAAQQHAFDDYLGALDLVDRRIEALEREVRQTAEREPWAQLVAQLRCLRGIDTLTALGIVCEVGDFSRFETAEEFMGFTGLVPSERASGERRKAGLDHEIRQRPPAAAGRGGLGRPPPPQVGYQLARRQRGQHPAVIERAWRCQQRLHKRWRRMAARGKPHQKIVVACARELAGFVWAIATDQPLRQGG
jgi:transposase